MQAHPALLWPPHHKLEEITITGMPAPAGQQVQVTITQVTQDEPVGCTAQRGSRDYDADDDKAYGCRHTTPDAIVHPHGHVLIRAERREHGNGRVYHIT